MCNICVRLQLDQIGDVSALIRKERHALLAARLCLIKKKEMSIQLAHLPLHDPDPKKYKMQFWKRVESNQPFSQLL
jgi:hypothetical protein